MQSFYEDARETCLANLKDFRTDDYFVALEDYFTCQGEDEPFVPAFIVFSWVCSGEWSFDFESGRLMPKVEADQTHH